jgi:hypothetical protein
MKPLVILFTLILTLAVVCGYAGPAFAAGDGFPSIIVLTAKDVKSAADIEMAIYRTTDAGTHLGAVYLDGMYGPFVYTRSQGSDQTLDIAYSNLTLRGVNGAAITNGNGIVFDPAPLENIVIENLAMVCIRDCITSRGQHSNIRIQNNTLIAGGVGILVAHTSDWTITGNTIQAGWTSIYLMETNQMQVELNRLSSPTPLVALHSDTGLVQQNQMDYIQAGLLRTTFVISSQSPVGSVCWVESSDVVVSDTPGNLVYTSQVQCASVTTIVAEGAVNFGSITP